MRNGFTFITRLLVTAAVAGSTPTRVQAQTASLTLTQYYDSARTRPRVRYQVQLRGTRPDTVPHGSFRRYWPGGSLAEHGRLTNGQPDSVWTRYYPAAPSQPPTVARRLPMRTGQPEGPFVVLQPDGRVAQRGTFRQGQLVDSLVTTGRDGQPRLLASFAPTAGGGLQGTFRQWHSPFTAQGLRFGWLHNRADDSYEGLHTSKGMEPYWQGRLTAGHFTGSLTEHDASGQLRSKLEYTPTGYLRQSTVYYPAAWLQYEAAGQYGYDTIMTSQPFLQWQAVGGRRLLLQRHWGVGADVATYQLFKVVSAARHRRGFVADIVGYGYRTEWRKNNERIFSDAINARAVQLATPILPAECRAPHTAYQVRLRPVTVLLARRRPGRWCLGEADTMGIVHRPAHRRTSRLPNGQLVVETRHAQQVYYPSGRLAARNRHLLGYRSHSYHPNGEREYLVKDGILGYRLWAWNEQGQLTAEVRRSPLGEHPGRVLKRRLKQFHPLRQLRQQLRRFHPLRPVYRKVGKLFHHKKQSRRDSPGT